MNAATKGRGRSLGSPKRKVPHFTSRWFHFRFLSLSLHEPSLHISPLRSTAYCSSLTEKFWKRKSQFPFSAVAFFPMAVRILCSHAFESLPDGILFFFNENGTLAFPFNEGCTQLRPNQCRGSQQQMPSIENGLACDFHARIVLETDEADVRAQRPRAAIRFLGGGRKLAVSLCFQPRNKKRRLMETKKKTNSGYHSYPPGCVEVK